jgi:hypothetical protein
MSRHAVMNHIRCLVWDCARHVWVVASEIALGMGQASSRCSLTICGGLLLVFLSAFPLSVQASPTGGQVVVGSGAISHSGDTTTISQSSPNLSVS